MIAILLAGTALRLVRLGAGSLWYDETVSVYLAGSPVPELLRHTAGDIHPPGYYLLLRGWLLLTGYPTGHADAAGQGLEFASAFFSCFFGVLLIALAYRLALALAGRRTALWAAALVAISPYNVWYGQEVRMYTLGAALAVIALGALWQATGPPLSEAAPPSSRRPIWWAIYAVAAAAGMYTLYYFAFFLLAANLWAAWRLFAPGVRAPETTRSGHALGLQHTAFSASYPPSNVPAWLLANLAAVLLYAPWIPVAWRQATQPPVPPWRAAVGVLDALRESWTALGLGQSAPAALWPAALMLLPLYLLGLYALTGRDTPGTSTASPRHPVAVSSPAAAALLFLATFGSLALVLVASHYTPLYHVRYVFLYSTFFYIVLAAGLAWLAQRWAAVAALAGVLWLAGAAVALASFWSDPRFRPDDHRAAVAVLQSHWRPGDVVLVNAGYAYTTLATYWQPALPRGDAASAWRTRLTAELPQPRSDAGLLAVTSGHIDGEPGLGWNDPRSDFFALPAATAAAQVRALYERFARIWQYRIYDTVNDPGGRLRDALASGGRLCEDQVFPGEASLRVQAYASRARSDPPATWSAASIGDLDLRAAPIPAAMPSGQTIYPELAWRAEGPLPTTADALAASLRLVAPDGTTWAQPPDTRVGGALCPPETWAPGAWLRQSLALPIPDGTPPGEYAVALVAYDPTTGRPLPVAQSSPEAPGGGLLLGQVQVDRPEPPPPSHPALATFGPLALLAAGTPAARVSPGDTIPVDLTWQAASAPGEPLVVVVQLLDGQGRVAAGLEAQPLRGKYPTQTWAAGEIVRDLQALTLPRDLPPGMYSLAVGLYRAADGSRFSTRQGAFGQAIAYPLKKIAVGP